MASGGTEPWWRRAWRLVSLLPRRPTEFSDRARALVTTRAEGWRTRRVSYTITPFDRVLQELDHHLEGKVLEAAREAPFAEIESQVRQRIEVITPVAPFPLMHNADFALARVAYLVCRALRPSIVLETGVAYGVTSAFVLRALELNAHGSLHSVDLAPLRERSDQFVGAAIPEGLKSRWHLHRGASRRVLPEILPDLEPVDVFIHDSLHTLQNMLAEFRLVTPRLAHPAVVLADDIHFNRAYESWTTEAAPTYSAVVGELAKPGLFGVAVLGARAARRT
jgi:methyltransferase family protein